MNPYCFEFQSSTVSISLSASHKKALEWILHKFISNVEK